jgi:peptide/nickel transport system substrate-binding protein
MSYLKAGTTLAIGATTAALLLGACTSSGTPGKTTTGHSSSAGGHPAVAGQKSGGTLYVNNFQVFPHLDPQRNYSGYGITFAIRTIDRTLTTSPALDESDPAATEVVPQAATSTGTSTDDNKTWSFTLRSGMRWQDGRAVTCADFKYGVSRTFATDQITGGPTYAISYLDIPTKPDGSSAYLGPYSGTGQALYDKAVVCSGNTITFHLKRSVADFAYTVSLPEFAAIRRDKDTGAKYDFTPFSDGPYMLQGAFDQNTGGTFVRNPYWTAASDPVDKAYPDKIVVEYAPAETAAATIISDNGPAADMVSMQAIPPSYVAQVQGNPALSKRTDIGFSGLVQYLTVNVKQLPNVKVRQALAMAVDKNAYDTAEGGSTTGKPTNSLIAPNVLGYTKYDPFGTGFGGSVSKAKALLKSAGVPLPVKITYAYPKSPTEDKAATSIRQNLNAAGFDVTLDGLGNNYGAVIQNPSQTPQLTLGGWGADWASASTVIPPLFDSRVNITPSSLGQDVGQYADPSTNAAMDAALDLPTLSAQANAWAALDKKLVTQGAAVPLQAVDNYFIYGSNVQGFVMNSYAGYVDLGVVAVR